MPFQYLLFNHGQCKGLYPDNSFVDLPRQVVFEIIFVYLFGAVDYAVHTFRDMFELCRKAELFFHLIKLSLGTLDSVPYALTGDTLVFGNFGKREIVVVIIIKKIPLLLGENVAVKII